MALSAAGEPVLVLLHSPLVGPLTWQPVADELRRRGRQVVVPRLDNDSPPPLYQHHAERVRRAVEAEATGAPVVLVGHSGAGPILPAAGTTLVAAVAGYVFVDSDLPHDRLSRLAAAPPEFARHLAELEDHGMVAPWTDWWDRDVLAALVPDEALRDRFAGELAPLPRRLFEEPIPVPAEWPDAPCGYVQLSRAYDEAATRARRLGWDVVHLDAGHLHMLVDPVETAEVVVELAGRLVTTAAGTVGAGAAGTVAGGASAGPGVDPAAGDPVAATRRRIGRYVELGRRVGFGALALAIALFAVALYWDLPSGLVQLVIAALVVASVALLPSIIVGYGLAAAEREDRERDTPGPHPT